MAIVAVVAVAGIALLATIVLSGKPHDNGYQATPPDPVPVADAPDAHIVGLYLEQARNARTYTKDYLKACGCPDHYDASGIQTNLPRMVKGEPDAAFELRQLQDRTKGVTSDDIGTVAERVDAIATAAQKVIDSATTVPPGVNPYDVVALHELENAIDQATAADEQVQKDMGIGTGTVAPPG